MTVSRRSAIKAIGVVGTGSALSGTVLGVNEHEDDERDPESVSEDEETGAIRVAHFSPDAPNVDVYVNDQRILADVAYEDVSPYLEVVPGTYALTITAAGDPETIVYEQQFAVDTGYYTAAAIGELEAEGENDESADDDAHGDEMEAEGEDDGSAGAHENGAADDETAADTEDETPDTGTFDVLLLADRLPSAVEEHVEGEDAGQVRVVHASPDAPNVDIYVADSPSTVFEDLEFTVPSGYVAVQAGTVSLDVFPAGEGPEKEELEPDGEATEDETIEPDADDADDPEPVATFDLDVEAGQGYTVYAIGYLEPQDDQDNAFDVVTLVDATTEDDDEMEDDADYDADDEVDQEPMDEGDDHAANDTTSDDYAANDTTSDDHAANDTASGDDVAADGGDYGNETDAGNETDDY